MVNFQYMDSYGVEDLLHIMELLRAPEGCPWDQEQTHQSIRRNMLEEAYEAVEAIDEEDPEHLKEELGDVLLQVVFHACMAAEEGLFTFDDVVDGVAKKMVFRHPHVFGTVRAEDSVQALDTWDAQKREEKAQRTATDTLEAVARSLPAPPYSSSRYRAEASALPTLSATASTSTFTVRSPNFSSSTSPGFTS